MSGQSKELSVITEEELNKQVLAVQNHAGMRVVGNDTSPSSGLAVKTPLMKRIRKSKFAALIEKMSDNDLKLTAYAICFNDDVKEAVKCYHTSVGNYVQIAALIKELTERDITINM